MKSGIFITGTDTGIGKTFVSSLLLSAAAKCFPETFYFKPIQTGDESDTRTVQEMTALSDSQFIPPVYHFSLPASPNRAAAAEGKTIAIQNIIDHWQQMPSGQYILEGAGGIMVPLHQQIKIIDLIKCLEVPILLVSSTRLGTINHTLLTLAAIKQYNIPIRGIILNGEKDEGLAAVLAEQTDVAVLAEIPQLNVSNVKEISTHYFTQDLVNKIFDVER